MGNICCCENDSDDEIPRGPSRSNQQTGRDVAQGSSRNYNYNAVPYQYPEHQSYRSGQEQSIPVVRQPSNSRVNVGHPSDLRQPPNSRGNLVRPNDLRQSSNSRVNVGHPTDLRQPPNSRGNPVRPNDLSQSSNSRINVVRPNDLSQSSNSRINVVRPNNFHQSLVKDVNEVPSSHLLQPKKIQSIPEKRYEDEKYERKLHELQQYENRRMWKNEDIVSQMTKVPKYAAKDVINLLEEGSTVPFIARYCGHKIVNIPPENLREIQSAYANIQKVHGRVNSIFKILAEENIAVDEKFLVSLVNAKTIEEVEFLYAPFNPENQMTFAEAFESLGLGFIAHDILEGKKAFSQHNLAMLIKSQNLEVPKDEVIVGLQHFIADIVSKNQELLNFINNHNQKQLIHICTCQSNEATAGQEKHSKCGKSDSENFKFERYHNFSVPIKHIKPHQVLAINRGESQNVLIVTVVVPQRMKDDVLNKCRSLFCERTIRTVQTSRFLSVCFEDAYGRLIEPQLIKQVRTEITKTAVKESVKVFCENLKRLLLTPPVRGEPVLALDPGFTHGCKVAAVACNGNVLQTELIFPEHSSAVRKNEAVKKISHMVHTHQISIIALGNGTGCRETEVWLTNLIHRRLFRPHKVKYCIVDENGASIYSVTKEAENDLPGMAPNFRSAVSIARRLQDPLSEYVKIDPKHLGVGMYQHDLPEEVLKDALDNVVVECVSFVGVDLNACSEVLLGKVSGLSTALARQIILWRQRNGCFINRLQLLEVKNLSHKCFQQCAGFVKILPSTCIKSNCQSSRKYVMNPLDGTAIHPESYEVAVRLLSEVKCDLTDVGTPHLKKSLTQYVQYNRTTIIAKKFQMPVEKMKFVIDALMQPLEYDIRQEFAKPLFKTGIKSIEDLTTTNEVLTGRVVNVTHFGAFVDIGVGRDGLLHTSKMRNKSVALGDNVSVVVLSVDVKKQKIALKLVD